MRIKKTILKTIITILAIEFIYLFATPIALNSVINKDYIRDLFTKKTNLNLSYADAKIQTHILPSLTLKLNNFILLDQNDNQMFINIDEAEVNINLLNLLFKTINLKELSINHLDLNLEKDENGNFNFEKFFPKKDKKSFKFSLRDSDIQLNKYTIKFNDKELNKIATIQGKPFVFKGDKSSNKIYINTTNSIITNNKTASEFDININLNNPSLKNINENTISGKFIAYNIDLDLLEPFIQQYFDKNSKQLSGFIDYLQISSEINKDNKNEIIINTSLKDIIYDRNGWKNFVDAKGSNKIDARIELEDQVIGIKSFNFDANKVNIKSYGKIKFENKPYFDVTIEVNDSRAENIAQILPPNLVPSLMTIEKVKNYGVYGDLQARVQIKGSIPKPDITGYVKGNNIKVLDKSIHKTHNGTVDLKFNKNILNMDILVEMPNKQKTSVKGYTYMFRDGINNVDIKSTPNLDFSLAQKIIIPVSKVFNFQLGPIPDMNITSGNGIIDLNIQGCMDLINLKGYSEFDNAKLTYNGIFGEVTQGKGRIDFNKDVISFKSDKAFVNGNPLGIDGHVKINDNLDFNISSIKAKAEDVIEIINKSELLKDVKAGLAIITKANGNIRLVLNIKSNIVPVPYGHQPLPPEEAFTDMKVNGSVYMFGDTCYLEGFYTPIEKIKGIVDFTETETILRNLTGVSGTSPITIKGKILNDLETKIPDIDIDIDSKNINLRDTIKFLAESYMYPKDFMDLSSFYKIGSKHDLHFKYKAKSIDFDTKKAYAIMNFINDETLNSLEAKSGKIIMENGKVKIDNIVADFVGGTLKLDGEVDKIETTNPIYDLKIQTNKIDIARFNNINNIDFLPKEFLNIIKEFKDFAGSMETNIHINKNHPQGEIKISNFSAINKKTNIPLMFDDFVMELKNDKLYINNITAKLGDIPFFGNFIVSHAATDPTIDGYFTTKITNNFVKNYLPKSFSDKFQLVGDINLSSKINGNASEIIIQPKFVLNPDADVIYDGTSLGEITEKREFDSYIVINKDKINVKKLDYIKYISSQNNKTYPMTFAKINGILRITKDKGIVPEEINVKSQKTLSTRILNIFLKKQILRQGMFNCDLKYITDKKTNVGKLFGKMDCRNIDIPVFDILLKNIEINADKDAINIETFGYLSDSRIIAKATLNNSICDKPNITSLKLYADEIDDNKLLKNLYRTHASMEKGSNIKNLDLSGLSLDNGLLEIKTIKVKALTANNFRTKFSVNKNGIFTANDMQLNVGEGIITGDISYDLNSTKMISNFTLNNVDSNYVAETLFDGRNQIYGNANGKIHLETMGLDNTSIIKNLNGFVHFDVLDGRMPKLGSLEYLLRASNIVKGGITSFSLNNILEILNLVKTGYFTSITGGCAIENGIAKDIEIYSQGENLSLYIHGNYDISLTNADMEILGKLSKKISTVFGAIGNTSLNTFFRLIPGISLTGKNKNIIRYVEKIPAFTTGNYESRTFQAIINGNINESGYVQSFKWVE